MLTKAQRVAFARCWGLWVRWLALEKMNRRMGGRLDRAVLYRLAGHIWKEHEDG